MPQKDRRSFAPAWAALTDPKTGRLPSFVPLDALLLGNEVDLDRGVLRFQWKSGLSGFDFERPPSNLLARFIDLRTDAAILSFAKRFGPLWLFQRGKESLPQPKTFSSGRPSGEQRESLKDWRRYQWEFNALLALSAALRERQSPKRELFEEFERLGVIPDADLYTYTYATAPSLLESWSSLSVDERLRIAGTVVQTRTANFARWCRLRPALTIESSRITLVFQDATADHRFLFGLSLFGALTVQLLAATTGAGFATCSACGTVFVPRRRQPAFGKRRYCRMCGRAAALKDAKADYRARSRATRTMEAGRRRSK
jgi:hypothetical protein